MLKAKLKCQVNRIVGIGTMTMSTTKKEGAQHEADDD